MSIEEDQKLDNDIEHAEIVLLQKKQEVELYRKQLVEYASSLQDEGVVMGGELIIGVGQVKNVDLKGAPAPLAYLTCEPASAFPDNPKGFTVYEGMVLQVKNVASANFKLKVVPYTKDDSATYEAYVSSADFLEESAKKAQEGWYAFTCTSSTEESKNGPSLDEMISSIHTAVTTLEVAALQAVENGTESLMLKQPAVDQPQMLLITRYTNPVPKEVTELKEKAQNVQKDRLIAEKELTALRRKKALQVKKQALAEQEAARAQEAANGAAGAAATPEAAAAAAAAAA
eukprot:CAMPEP_0194570020 /NCGR_PEP_ID=MMETSP0292-20121207/7497_1 /TAXON_ID=39354 /ORGANISM="Heterosigma akashiwo, Strain CCMP2393" /LENGTH=286 /DNA_ID=CAMNT_0039420375 /DNA_START=69 /DNA_END=926 /DNA_ORIENTATION=+